MSAEQSGYDLGETPPKPDAQADLREVTAETVRDVCRLTVAPGQERFVTPNSVSIAEAYLCEKA